MRKTITTFIVSIILLTITLPVQAVSVDIANNCGYVQSGKTNPDYQTVNCLLTEAALSYNIPPEVVKGIAQNENGFKQFENGEPIISDDGGIGIMQITTVGDFDVEKLKNDIVYNINAGVQILNDMYKRTDLPKINNGDRDIIEHWYFAVMAYNGTKPVNSPIVQATGERNKDAYQEKVFQSIEDHNVIDLVEIPFDKEDFEYDSNSDENIEFVTTQYNLNLPFNESKHYFKKNQMVGATTSVNVRTNATTESNTLGRLKKGEKVEITGPFVFDKSTGSQKDFNHFVWYPIKRSDGTTGYVASSYLDYRFKDVPEGHYAEDEIYYLTKRGIINGVGNDNFGLEQKLTRWQAALMVVRANHDSMENRPDPGFVDVPKSYEWYDAIATAVDEGYFQGLDDKHFAPEKTLTRGEMAVLLQRLYQFPDTNVKPPFTDLKDDWYKDDVAKLYSAGITDGVSATKYAPHQSVTREQFATFMVRSMDEEYRLK